ncbi:MFS family permease [Microbacterium resistens]|uniref:MFS family permease n=1 Tax=Microbacterium resistens TaxID=156977 RepID=A0ABU1SH24_9MICO|nr:MFS transporter [Microbacterium resistens]MDR6868931.1 MFS family permease [Microbacterium resistens]
MTSVESTRTRYGFWVSLVASVVFVAQTAAPSPLYPTYREEWGLSAVTLAVVFAVYVVGLLLVLLTGGALSDFVGRKPVVAVAGVLAIAGLIVLAVADNVWMLVVARILQGACVGLIGGALGAALMDFHLPGRVQLSVVLNGAVPPLALGVGAMAAAILANVLPAPTQSVYFVFAGAVLVCTVLWLFVEERGPKRPGALRSLVPSLSIPERTRPVFMAVVGSLCAAWALAGLYVGSAGQITGGILGIPGPLSAGFAILALQIPGTLTGVLTARAHARPVILSGLGALILGAALTAWALAAGSVWGFFVSTVIAGAGFGAGFQGGLRLILAQTDALSTSGVLSAVYATSYLAFGIPSVIAGFLIPQLGLSVTTYWYLGLVAAVAAVAFVFQLRTIPATQAEEAAEVQEAIEMLDDRDAVAGMREDDVEGGRQPAR